VPAVEEIITLAVGIGLTLLLWFLILRFAGVVLTDEQILQLEDLGGKYRGWEAIVGCAVLACWAGIGYVFYEAICLLASVRYRSFAGEPFLVTPSDALWALAAGCLSVALSVFPVQPIVRRQLGDRFEEYRLYTLRYGFDPVKAFGIITAIPQTVALVCLFFGLNSYTRFTQDAVVHRSFWALRDSRHGYTEVASLYDVAQARAPNGHIIDDPHVVIEFEDGTRWSSWMTWRDPSPQEDRQILQWVSQRSGKPIRRVRLLDPKPGQPD